MRSILKFPKRPKTVLSPLPSPPRDEAAILRLADHRHRPAILQHDTGPPGHCRIEFRGDVR